jgi:hypothetical protein
MDAAKDLSIGFYTVPDHPTVAVRANRRKRVDRALKAIEDVALVGDHHFERLVIFVFANFAFRHTSVSSAVAFAAVSDYFRRRKLFFTSSSGPGSLIPGLPWRVLPWFVGEADSFLYSFIWEVEMLRESDTFP